MRIDVRKLCVLAMMSALAFILAAFVRVPVIPVPPLRYDPKDIVILIAGFIYGPMAAFIVTVVVSFVQMITVSATGYFGLIMNIISGTAFCCTAAFIYKKKRTVGGAIFALVVAVVFATAVMIAWNYVIIPMYTGRARADVIPLLIPAILPFNLVSNSLNAALTMLLYKHVKTILQKMNMMPPAEATGERKGLNIGVIAASLFVVLTCVIWYLMIRGIL